MMDTGSVVAALLVLAITGGYFLSIIFRGLATPISSQNHRERDVGAAWAYTGGGGDGGSGGGLDGGGCGGDGGGC